MSISFTALPLFPISPQGILGHLYVTPWRGGTEPAHCRLGTSAVEKAPSDTRHRTRVSCLDSSSPLMT